MTNDQGSSGYISDAHMSNALVRILAMLSFFLSCFTNKQSWSTAIFCSTVTISSIILSQPALLWISEYKVMTISVVGCQPKKKTTKKKPRKSPLLSNKTHRTHFSNLEGHVLKPGTREHQIWRCWPGVLGCSGFPGFGTCNIW